MSGADAVSEATEAARAAGVSTRAARSGELIDFFEGIWGEGRVGDPSFIRAIVHAGNSALVAERGGVVVGAALGVLGWDGGLHLHSHMVAVDPTVRAGGVGFAIKLAQRAECLGNGVTEMRWTFDPLIRRNAHVNLVKLGATVRQYLPDFYGDLDDDINGNDRTDRFEVSWLLDAPVGATPSPGATGLPLAADFEALRREDPAAASALRARSAAWFAGGGPYRFTGEGWSRAGDSVSA
jgi:predicted GNAT superfamily acetyltransferase